MRLTAEERGTRTSRLAACHHAIGLLHQESGNTAATLLSLRRELECLEYTPDEDHRVVRLGICLSTIAQIHFANGDHGSGLRYSARLLELAPRLPEIEEEEREDLLMELRSMARELTPHSHYRQAEEALLALRRNGFEEAGTDCHLIRLYLLAGRPADAADALKRAKEHAGGAERYVCTRVHFFEVVLSLLESGTGGPGLARLKKELRSSDAHSEWTIQPTLDHFRDRLGAPTYALLTALAEALNDRRVMTKLDRIPAWYSEDPRFKP